MELCVLHYHYRPGGVRQVIATGLPALARAAGFTSVRLAGGEEPENAWRDELERTLHPLPVSWVVNPALGYWSETKPERAAVEQALISLASRDTVLWVHNLSVGRNFHLMRAAGQSAALWNALWVHHHDWWWDGRWQRWPEMLVQGAENLTEAVKATLLSAEKVRHFTINPQDAKLLSTWYGCHFSLVENPVLPYAVTLPQISHAKEWLRQLTGRETHWLYPCRMMRRKNVAEALLVQSWLAPEAATITTGGASSAAELPYARVLSAAAEQHGWPLFAGVCAGQPDAPSVPALIAAADAIIVTSLQEGFGLPYREAAMAGRPLFARTLPCIAGATPHCPSVPVAGAWHEVPVPKDTFDSDAEISRTALARRIAASLLPTELRMNDRVPCARDFGSLSLPAQIEVLEGDPVRTRPSRIFPPIRQSLSVCPARSCSPEHWAAQLLNSARQSAAIPSKNWAQRAPEFLSPLVLEWLRRPLLFPA